MADIAIPVNDMRRSGFLPIFCNTMSFATTRMGCTHVYKDNRRERHRNIDQAHENPDQPALVRQEILEHRRRVEEHSVDSGQLLGDEDEGDEKYGWT
jgi:hypothetical protein